MKYVNKLGIAANFVFGSGWFVRKFSFLVGYKPLFLMFEDRVSSRRVGDFDSHHDAINDDPFVLFAPVFGFADAALNFESLLIDELKCQGLKSRFLACGGNLKVCMHDTAGYISGNRSAMDEVKRRVKCADCSMRIRRVATHINAPTLELPRVPGEVEHDRNILALDDGHATNSALRKCLIGDIYHLPEAVNVKRRFALECVSYRAQLEELFTEKLPSAVVMVHGIYLEHGVLVDFFRDKGVPIYVYGFAYRQGTVSIVAGDTYHLAVHDLPTSVWDYPLNGDQQNAVNGYLRSKLSGGRDFVNYHPSAITDEAAIVNELGAVFDMNCPTILFCTNVLWDAALYYSSDAYPTLMGAIQHVIEAVDKSTGVQLVIRLHPAEAKGGFATAQPIYAEILKLFPVLPHNVFIVKPESDLSTYVLGDMSSVVFNYASNVGLEFACVGKPVVNLGKPYAYNRGFTIDISHRSETEELIKDLSKISEMTPHQIELANRFAHFWFFRFMTDIKGLIYDVETVSKLHIPESREACPNASSIARAIRTGGPIPYQEFVTYG